MSAFVNVARAPQGGRALASHHLLHEPLDIQVEDQDGTAVVRITGTCDMSCHEQLRERLLFAEAHGVERIVVDLTGLRFIDSLGLRVVIAAWNRARQAGHSFSVALATSGQVRRVFELTGVDQIVPTAAVHTA